MDLYNCVVAQLVCCSLVEEEMSLSESFMIKIGLVKVIMPCFLC